MFAGILLIVCGLLIAFFPQLLSLIVASVLILIGITTTLIAYDFRRSGLKGNSDVIQFIIRH